MLEFPLVQILLYLSLLLAPADATRISVSGPTPADNLEIRLTVNGWARTQNEVEERLSISGQRLLISGEKQTRMTDLSAHVPSLKNHDWKASPKLSLAGLSSLEKTASGYVFRLNDDSVSDTRSYVITYHLAEASDPASAISINVIGHVNNPGAYKLAKGATLLDAITAASGFNRLALRTNVKLTRGRAGEKPEIYIIDVNELIRTSRPKFILETNDTIFVPEIYL